MQFMTICNKVLTKLRKSSLTSTNFTTDSYGLLIQQFVNEAKHEVEDAWRWSMLRKTITITTDGVNDVFTLTGATQRCQLLDAYNTSQKWQLQEVPSDYMRTLKKTSTASSGHAEWYTPVSDTQISDNTVNFQIYPYSVSGDSLDVMVYDPQADLSTYTDNLYIPEQPVIFLAYAKAVHERGEDGGMTYTDAYAQYEKSLAQAIAIDAQRLLSATDWEVV